MSLPASVCVIVRLSIRQSFCLSIHHHVCLRDNSWSIQHSHCCHIFPFFIFIIIVQFMMTANIRIRFGLQIVLVFLCSTPSHYHPCANLSEGIEVIKCLSDIFCRVCKIKHILCVIQYTICGLYVFSLPIYLVMIERIYMLCLIIIIES